MISAYGITEVVYREHYAHDDTAIEIADRFGIKLLQIADQGNSALPQRHL